MQKWADLKALKTAVKLRPPDGTRKPGYHSASVGVRAYRNLTLPAEQPCA